MVRETRHRSVLAGAAIGSPSGGAPLPRCFRPAAELASQPLTSSVAPVGSSPVEACAPSFATRRGRQACFPRRLVKDADFHLPGRLPSTSAPSARFRLASAGTRHRSHDFAVAIRLPAPVRPSTGERLDPPPWAVGQAPLVDFCNQYNPRARPLDRLNPVPHIQRAHLTSPTPCEASTARCNSRCHGGPRHDPSAAETEPEPSLINRRGTRFPGGFAPCEATPTEVSRDRGRMGFRPSGALRRDCSRRKLRPDPIGSDTSCRELVTTLAGEAKTVRRTHELNACYEPTGRPSLSRDPPRDPLARAAPPTTAAFATAAGARAASRDLPRRRPRSAAPEVPSIDVLPHSRAGL
jgi:hypothetical protein